MNDPTAADHSRLWISRYYASFDGLRALAITSVFLCHYGPLASPIFDGGYYWAGVDLFFVLSGFLITGILYEARDSPTYFRDFYVRRALRILPVYYGLLFALLLLAPVLHLRITRDFPINFAFLQNLFYRYWGFHHAGPNATVVGFHHSGIQLGVLWSLCVEEQFYLLWPFVLRLLRSRKKILRVAIATAAAVILIRCLLLLLDSTAIHAVNYLYYEPYTRFDALLIGAAFNLWLQRRRLTRLELRRLSAGLFLGSVLILSLAFAVVGSRHGITLTDTVGFTLVDLAAAGLLLRSLDDRSRLSSLLRLPWIKRLGMVSYGFYVIHGLFTDVLGDKIPRLSPPLRTVAVVLTFVTVYGLAELSFRYWEQPFLRLKSRLAPAAHPTVPRPEIT